ncbi:hypothetical protein ACGFIY_33340 [Micromonospora chersina]|uniref:hypothetical protein n=1 Tax=Micromonospora chersina TaxID=47854 RepID=UPI00371BEBF4
MAKSSGGTHRRTVLKAFGVAAGAVAVGGAAAKAETIASLLTAANPENVLFELLRPEDQLRLVVHYEGQAFDRVVEDGTYVLTAQFPTNLTIIMAPQHVVEWAAGPYDRPTAPIYTDDTRLYFNVPLGTKIPLSITGILSAMESLPLVTHPLAGTVAKVPAPTARTALKPAADVLRAAMAPFLDSRAKLNDTYLAEARLRGAAQVVAPAATKAEAPDTSSGAATSQANLGLPSSAVSTSLSISRLFLSPPGGATRFSHATEPVRHGKPWAEVWSTRLMVETDDGGRVAAPLFSRAFFTLDATDAADLNPGKLSTLNVPNAQAILNQNATLDPQNPNASAIRLSDLQLSPRLGASASLKGKWPNSTVPSFALTLSTGRDVDSRITTTGRLYPLGHTAVQDLSIERYFLFGGPGLPGASGNVAPLRKLERTTVVNSHMPYPGTRTWPFTQIEILDGTPPAGNSKNVGGTIASYLEVDGAPYEYRCRGIDKAGNPVEFSMPLIFVPDTMVSSTDLNKLAAAYANDPALSKVFLNKVNVVEPAADSVPGAAEVTGEASFVSAFVAGTSPAKMEPAVTQFTGRLTTLGQLTDQSQPQVIKYAQKFLDYGFSLKENPGEVLFELTNALPVKVVDGKAAGGLVGALGDLAIRGTSRKLGPIAGTAVKTLETVALGQFNPEEYLGDFLKNLNLFGIFPLKPLIAATAALSQAPKLVAAAVDGMRTQSFTWSAPLLKKELVVGGAKLAPRDGLPADESPQLTLEAVIEVGVDGQLRQRTRCLVTDLQVTFGLGGSDLIRLPINSIEFVSVGTEKPNVDIDLGQIRFFGVLAYVDRLASLIGSNGFSGAKALPGANAAPTAPPNGPSLDITTSGVQASYALAIPSVAIGMFSLENILFGASLDLPFQGSPRFDFNFATQENPFRLTVSALGGGGFLGLGMSVDKGLERIEGALEFGAQMRIDLKLVSGKVSAMGGVYFKKENGSTTLTGYLSIHGEVSVLSIVTLGVMATLLLTYYDGKVRGEAELVFYISTFFFSKTVKRTFSRTFVGSNGDPTFAELMAPEGLSGPRPWDTYCKAFA